MATKKDFRFEWKNQIRRAQGPSAGAKQFASYIVDEFIRAGKTTCWPGNKILMAGLGVSERSIQRYIAELVETGWIRVGKKPGVHRVIGLRIPPTYKGDVKRDTEGDIEWHQTASEMSPKDANTVAPYKKHEEKHGKRIAPSLKIPSQNVLETEHLNIAEWQTWLNENTDHSWADVMAHLFKNGVYTLPSRFPPTSDNAENALAFFDAMIPMSNSDDA